MYVEVDGRTFLPVKKRTYEDMWEAIMGEPWNPVGFHHLEIGGVALVEDTEHFHEWAAKSRSKK
jgi:hypothetical protein